LGRFGHFHSLSAGVFPEDAGRVLVRQG
jgi:hypothetical protein